MEVKAVNGPGGKSIQEQEEQFAKEAEANKAAEEQAAKEAAEAEGKKNTPPEGENNELDDSKVLEYFKTKHNKEVNSLEELLTPREKVIEKEVELPEDINAILEYKKKTGRGLEDYIKLNQDFSKMDDLSVIKQQMRLEDPDATEEEIAFEIEERFSIDEDLDETDDEYKRIMMKRQKEARKARKFLESQKEEYYKPVERAGVVPEEDKEDYEAYKQYIESSKSEQEAAERRAELFKKKTDEVFGEGFEGFEVKIGEDKFTFKPGDAEELKSLQSTPMNFIKKYLDEDGNIKDAKGYHTALAFAMHPEKAAEHFLKKGMAMAREEENKRIRNVDFSPNNAGFGSVSSEKVQVKAVGSRSTGGSLKVKPKINT